MLTSTLEAYDVWDTGEIIARETTQEFICSSGTPCRVLECESCKGTAFIVGAGIYHTSIKCVKCDKPVCVHSG